jgi:predicted PurR-regulated permease PerM
MAPERPVPRFFLLLIAAAALLLAFVFLPIISELFLAAVLAGVLWPLQQWLAHRLRGKHGVAAGVLTVLVVVLLVGPVATIATFVIRDGSDAVHFVSEALRSQDVADLVGRLPDATRDVVNEGIAGLPRTVEEVMGKVDTESGKTAAAVGAAVAKTGSIAFHTVLMVIALFFLLVRGDELVRWLDNVSPLGPGHTRELLLTFKKVSFAVVVSAVITAAVQAVAALVGFMIARVPSPVFFALVTFFVAFIPAIGAAVVCLVAALLLLVTGHPYMALFLACWGLVVVGLVDNLVKPLLIRRGLEIHGGIVFFALIGGLSAFGGIGILLGPLVVAMFLALVRIYHRDYTPGDTRVAPTPGLPSKGEETEVRDPAIRPDRPRPAG